MTSEPVILDTDVLSASMRGDERALPHVRKYLAAHSHLTFSLITRYEVLRGLKAKGATVQLEAFNTLCGASSILPVTDEIVVIASDVYARLHRSGALITDADILIGATALHYGLSLVTNNVAHLSRVPGLRILNWLAKPA